MPIYSLPDLPYAYDALAPAMSARQLELHHTKHHAAYVKQANELIERLADADAAAVPALTRSLAFNVSGHVLHSMFWESMTPGGSRPDGSLVGAIETSFGSHDALVELLGDAITSLQGSGWAALVWEPMAERLVVAQLLNHQDNGFQGGEPLLVIDGWEHAFYLDHQNDKAAYVEAVCGLLDWERASRRFEAVRSADVTPAR